MIYRWLIIQVWNVIFKIKKTEFSSLTKALRWLWRITQSASKPVFDRRMSWSSAQCMYVNGRNRGARGSKHPKWSYDVEVWSQRPNNQKNQPSHKKVGWLLYKTLTTVRDKRKSLCMDLVKFYSWTVMDFTEINHSGVKCDGRISVDDVMKYMHK